MYMVLNNLFNFTNVNHLPTLHAPFFAKATLVSYSSYIIKLRLLYQVQPSLH